MFFVSMMFVASVCFGQTGTTGVINGTVTDPDGVVLPGITVILKSPALVLPQMTTVSNAQGQYRFIGLAPGTYELTFQLEGMNTMVYKEIVVSVGKTSTLDVGMTLKTLEESIIVSGKTPTVDRQTTTRTNNMDLEFLQYIPALRTLGSYFNFAPGVTGDSVHGGSVRDTSYNLDGLNLADPVVGTQGVFFGLDIMEEISVETGGLSAQYGQTRGAVLNVVSKSGGNKFSGTASIYYRHESLQSDNTKGTPLEGEKSGYKYEMEPGLTLGGPLKKDKLWFFLNLSFNKREQNTPGYPYDQTTEIPQDDFRPYPYIKFTFQPNPGNKWILSYNYSDIRRHHRGADRYHTEEGTREQVTPTHTGNLHWTKSFGANFYMNFKAGGYYSKFDLLTKTGDHQTYEFVTGLYAGNYGFSDYNYRHRLQVNLDGTLFVDDFAGSHEMKFGGEFLKAWSGRKLTFSDTFDGNGFSAYIVYLDSGEPWYVSYYAPYDTKEEMTNIALFFQDNWSISKNLTLNLGLRFEHQMGKLPPQNTAEGPGDFGFIGYPSYTYDRSVTSAITGLKWTTLSPRLSLIYDILSDGTTLFKASYSRYYMANITQWFSAMNPNGFLNYAGYCGPDLSVYRPTGIGTPTPNIVGWGDHKLKAPYMDEVTIGVERELWEDWSISARYIRKWDRKLIEDVAYHQLDMDALMDDGELVWTNWVPVEVVDPYDGSTQTFYDRLALYPGEYATVNPPKANRDYDGIEITLNKRYSKGWQLSASYVFQKSRGLIGTDFTDSWGGTSLYDNPNRGINRNGRFTLERRNMVKIQGMLKGPWGINLGGYFSYLAGRRWERHIVAHYFGLSLSQGGTTNIMAEPRGSRGAPDLVILDLKVEKAFKFGPVNFRIFADIFNVFNGNKAVILTDGTGIYDISNHPTLVFGEMEDIQDPRIFRLGAKIEF